MKRLLLGLVLALSIPALAMAGETVTPYSYSHASSNTAKNQSTACKGAQNKAILTVKKHFSYTCGGKKCEQTGLTHKITAQSKSGKDYNCTVTATLTGKITTTTN